MTQNIGDKVFMKTEFRPGSFQILPTIIKNLIIINGLVFLAQIVFDGVDPGSDLSPRIGAFTNTFALHSIESSLFKPWQLLTHMFMHGGIFHIASNMFALWMFGSILENVWGPRRFLIFYLVCGLGAAALHLASLSWEYHGMVNAYNAFAQNPSELTYGKLINNEALITQMDPHDRLMLTRNWATDSQVLRQNASAISEVLQRAIIDASNTATLGASGAVFGCLAAFGYLFPNTYVFLGFFIPLKAKWFVLGYIALELIMVLQHSGGGIARWAHLGGALAGFLMVFFWNRKNRRSFH